MKITFTNHAKEKAAYLGISIQQVKIAIKRGSTYQQTDGLLAIHGYICVAYKKVGNNYKIKTVFER